MAEVTMTVEEYLRLTGRAGQLQYIDDDTLSKKASKRMVRKAKRSGKKDPKMARALRKANSMGRKKSGGFKKGWSQGKIMKKAHQLRRKM